MKQKTKWTRKCPNCNSEIVHININSFMYSIKYNRQCRTCKQKARKGRDSIETRLKKSISHIGKPSGNKGNHLTDKQKEHLSIKMSGVNNPFYNKKHSDETKIKMKFIRYNKTYEEIYGIDRALEERNKRKNKGNSVEYNRKRRLSCIKRIEQIKNSGNQLYPAYNKNSIPILEQRAKEFGITDLQHAENGGEFYIKELGYWVDGYSQEKNIIIEYYEIRHKNQIERDERRKQEIIDFLKCKFIEIKEWENNYE